MRLIQALAASSGEADLSSLTESTLESLSRREQYLSILEIFRTAATTQQQLIEGVTICWEYFIEHSLWDNEFPNLETFEKSFAFSGPVKAMVAEGPRSRRRIRKNLDAVSLVWGPIEEALPGDLTPPRISFHLSRLLRRLSQRVTLGQAIRCLREEVVNRCMQHRRRGKPVTYITLVDVHAVLALPADTSSAFAVGSTSSHSHVGRVQVVVPILSETARRAYLNDSNASHTKSPPGGDNKRINRRCYCPHEFIDKLDHLMSNPSMEARLRAFNFGVALTLASLCWDHIRSYFRRAVGLVSNNARGRRPFEERIMALHSHLEAGGDYSTFVAIKSKEGWFNATAGNNI